MSSIKNSLVDKQGFMTNELLEEIKLVADKHGVIVRPPKKPTSHQLLLFRNAEPTFYCYIDRRTGLKSNRMQIAIDPKIDDKVISRLAKNRFLPNGHKSTLLERFKKKSSNYDIFHNKEIYGQHTAIAIELAIHEGLNPLSDFLYTILSDDYNNLSVYPNEKNLLTTEIVKDKEEDPESNIRNIDEKSYRLITERRGQPKFRESLFLAFEGRCCVSGSSVRGVLEAAHIIPHSEEGNYRVYNGLLLRADIHTLYDLNLIGVDEKGIIHLADELKGSEYEAYAGQFIGVNELTTELSNNLKKRYESFSSSPR